MRWTTLYFFSFVLLQGGIPGGWRTGRDRAIETEQRMFIPRHTRTQREVSLGTPVQSVVGLSLAQMYGLSNGSCQPKGRPDKAGVLAPKGP